MKNGRTFKQMLNLLMSFIWVTFFSLVSENTVCWVKLLILYMGSCVQGCTTVIPFLARIVNPETKTRPSQGLWLSSPDQSALRVVGGWWWTAICNPLTLFSKAMHIGNTLPSSPGAAVKICPHGTSASRTWHYPICPIAFNKIGDFPGWGIHKVISYILKSQTGWQTSNNTECANPYPGGAASKIQNRNMINAANARQAVRRWKLQAVFIAETHR